MNLEFSKKLLSDHKKSITLNLMDQEKTEQEILDFISNDSVSNIITEHINKLKA